MAKGISIKIDGQWVTINENTEISIEMSSPVFNEQGTFSFPFELPYEENRHLFGSIGEPDGLTRLQELDGKSFELYFDDVLLYYGAVETNDEEEITDTIPLNFVSGNALLKDMIEGMKASDVEVKDKIYLGYTIERCDYDYYPSSGYPVTTQPISLDTEVFMVYENENVTYPYPNKPYCNVRICYQPEGSNGYKMLSAGRPWSGVCFYVAYFLDCLWEKLNLVVGRNDLLSYEDFNRLAFFTTKCEVDIEDDPQATMSMEQVQAVIPSFNADVHAARNIKFAGIKKLYANGKNFPKEDVSTIIESIKNAFGAKIIIGNASKQVDIILLKDILLDNEVIHLESIQISEVVKHYKKKGVIIKYSVSDEKDTAYNYNDWDNPVLFQDYETILKGIDSYDMSLYINTISGKTFRVKVDKDATDEKEWHPSLFEVAQFNKVKIGDDIDENCEEMEIGFKPVIMNAIKFRKKVFRPWEYALAAFVNVEMLPTERIHKEGYYTYGNMHSLKLSWDKTENYDISKNDKSPLRTLDSGFTLGVMRGPGNKAGIEYYQNDYDGNGNDAWELVPNNYAFDEDCINNWNQVYDYNGTEPGGANIDKMFSLKLRAQKNNFPIDSKYAKRGLVDRFLSEYAHFLANKKGIVFVVRMEVSQLINIKWEKKYKIGQRIGYINNISYSISNKGISNVTIELFTI